MGQRMIRQVEGRVGSSKTTISCFRNVKTVGTLCSPNAFVPTFPPSAFCPSSILIMSDAFSALRISSGCQLLPVDRACELTVCGFSSVLWIHSLSDNIDQFLRSLSSRYSPDPQHLRFPTEPNTYFSLSTAFDVFDFFFFFFFFLSAFPSPPSAVTSSFSSPSSLSSSSSSSSSAP